MEPRFGDGVKDCLGARGSAKATPRGFTRGRAIDLQPFTCGQSTGVVSGESWHDAMTASNPLSSPGLESRETRFDRERLLGSFVDGSALDPVRSGLVRDAPSSAPAALEMR